LFAAWPHLCFQKIYEGNNLLLLQGSRLKVSEFIATPNKYCEKCILVILNLDSGEIKRLNPSIEIFFFLQKITPGHEQLQRSTGSKERSRKTLKMVSVALALVEVGCSHAGYG